MTVDTKIQLHETSFLLHLISKIKLLKSDTLADDALLHLINSPDESLDKITLELNNIKRKINRQRYMNERNAINPAMGYKGKVDIKYE
jgi:hypothetical protein